MQFTTFLIAAAAATGAVAMYPSGYSNSTGNATATAYVTQTVTAYETYCPKKTVFTEGVHTYTGHKHQWVTVACPGTCTISNAVGSHPSVVPAGSLPKYTNGTVPAATTAAPAPQYTCPCAAASASASAAGVPAKDCTCPAESNNGGSAASTGSGSSSNGDNEGTLQSNDAKILAGNAMAALAVIGGVAAFL